ncbi:hypothetical protein [Arthrobacter sp. A5]|uniref:hypothetical protein n=1 Tax=Arthrobacter sp. A5 TaxID=576926 RepID=UPI003DA9AE75
MSAPAGFGKTTLLAEWLGETPGEDRCVAWLSLDPADNEPASFWAYVVTALQTAVRSVGSTALGLIATSPSPTVLVLTTVLNELAAAPKDVWLVLDDYHLVDGHDVGDGMVFLLEHLRPHAHVVISSLRSRSRGATTSPASSPGSPGMTGTSSITWLRRCSSTNRTRFAVSSCTRRFSTG